MLKGNKILNHLAIPINLHWVGSINLSRIPKSIQPVIKDNTSLSYKLRQAYKDFQVIILSEGYAMPLVSEANLLRIPYLQPVWLRCVILQCDNKNIVYARSIIPKFKPSNPWYSIKKMGTKPLGELLFQHKNLTRSKFEFCRTINGWTHHLPNDIKYTYARRCVFTHLRSPLLLTEVFIDSFCNGHDFLKKNILKKRLV